MLKLGGNIDSWCGKCNLMLAHTIEAMVGDKPARVHCNTCGAQHGYKPNKPNVSPRQSRIERGSMGARPGKGVSRYEGLLRDKNVVEAKRYSPQGTYNLGDVLEHPTFGVGVTTALKDGTKIEVLFKDGPKVLIQGRP